MAVAYSLYIEPEAHAARNELPGHVRQMVRERIAELAHNPRPSTSKPLQLFDISVPLGIELCRLRVSHWRIVYAIHDSEQWVWVLAIRRRPPYDYADLTEFVNRLT